MPSARRAPRRTPSVFVSGGASVCCPSVPGVRRLVVPGVLVLALVGAGCGTPPTETAPTYVGSASCSTCHADEARRWNESYHRLAMLPAAAGAPLHAPAQDVGPMV